MNTLKGQKIYFEKHKLTNNILTYYNSLQSSEEISINIYTDSETNDYNFIVYQEEIYIIYNLNGKISLYRQNLDDALLNLKTTVVYEFDYSNNMTLELLKHNNDTIILFYSYVNNDSKRINKIIEIIINDSDNIYTQTFNLPNHYSNVNIGKFKLLNLQI